jgi:outer membrane lipoprotein-sorting protein
MRPILFCAALAALSTSASAMTAEELVAKNLEARGGAAKLAALHSLHLVGKVRLGGASEAKTESWAVAPDGYRSEFSLQGMTAVSAWDGKQGWTVQPFQGRREPQKLSADDTKTLVEAADPAGPLVDYEAKGNKLEYLGTEDIDGTDAHKLRVTLKNGDTQVIYIDPDHFLAFRIVSHRMIRGQEEVNTVELGEYEKVDGIFLPFEVGGNQIEKAEINPTIDPKIFAIPERGAK